MTKFVLTIKIEMKNLLREAREKKGLKTREVAQLLGIDQALISKFESGSRKPTKDQVIKLASLLEIDLETIMIAWFKEKLLYEIGNDEYALKAMNIVREEVENSYDSVKRKISTKIKAQNKIVLPIGLSQRKYSKKSVNKKYNNPKPMKKIIPRINSLV